MCALACAGIDEQERAAIAAQCEQIRATCAAPPRLKRRLLRRRLATLRAGAAPGPSGWRNSLILAVADCDGGVEALLGFADLVSAGLLGGG